MPATASPLRVPTPGTFRGKFRFQRFCVCNTDDVLAYEKLRTQANDPASGITIENIRDLKEIEEHRDSDGNMTRIERLYIIVQWWVNDKKQKEKPEPRQGFFVEKVAGEEP